MAIKVQGDVIIKDDGGVQASSLKVDGLEYPKSAGTEGQVLTSGSSGTIDFENAPSVEAGAGINVSKSADNVYTVTSDVIGLLDYEGSVDLTSNTVPDTSSMPEGTSFVNSGDGAISAAWQGVTSESITNQVKPLDTVVWNTTDSKFDYYPNTDIPPVDLGYTPAANGGTITNTGGTAASIPMANGTTAGLSLNDYSKEEKDKLDSVSVKIDLYPDDPSSLGASTLQEVTDKGSHTTKGITLGGADAAAAKIQLNANGSAEFAGGATEITSSGAISVNRTAGTNDVFLGQLNDSATSNIKADGSAEFDGDVQIQRGASGITRSSNDVLTVEASDVTSKTRGISVLGKGTISSTYEAVQIRHGDDQNVTIKYDGSASFAGDVQLAGNAKAGEAGIKLEASGLVSVARAGNGVAVFGGYTSGKTTATSYIRNDGEAMFASTVKIGGEYNDTADHKQTTINPAGTFIQVQSTATSSTTALTVKKSSADGSASSSVAAINGDGSATFAADVNVGNRNPGSSSSAGTRIANESGVSGVYTQSNSSVNQSSPAFQALRGTDEIFKVSYDGSATFVSTITAGGYSFAKLTEL